MTKRLWAFFVVLTLLFGGILYRIYDISENFLSSVAGSQSTITVTVANSRGTIYDRNGEALVNGFTEYRAAVTPQTESLTALSGVLEAQTFAGLKDMLQNGKPTVVTLPRLAAGVGLSLFQVPVRYENRVLAPHLLGYLNADHGEGLTGMEQALDDVLRAFGGEATVTYTVDAHGRVLNGIEPTITNSLSNAKGGVQLTLDARLQRLAEDVAEKYIQKGAVVISDPRNGDILAMVSLPQFHPAHVADVLQDEDSPLLNRALCSYNCGSVFKIVTAAAALENGMSAQQTYYCAGKIDVSDTVFHCHQRLGHGMLDFKNAFSKSCNAFFIQLAQQTGGEVLLNLSQRLQLDSSMVICEGMQTASATLPDAVDLQAPAALANLSFGQGELTATPMHIAQLIGTVVNDGVMISPRVIEGYVNADGTVQSHTRQSGQRVLSATTCQTLKQMMQSVMTVGGTGEKGCPTKGVAGAKTGTAETGWQSAQDAQYPVVQSWFAGYYYPKENEPYVIVVLAEDADNTHADTSAVFREITDSIYAYGENA